MPRYDFRTPRLYLPHALAAGIDLPLEGSQLHYLRDVLRLRPGDQLLVFNGQDGEWHAELAAGGKRTLRLAIQECTRPQPPAGDLHYLFAPLKHARLDYVVQKAIEMGASRLQPVLTRHCQVGRVNLQRMRANAIEAAEQCGILTLADIAAPLPFDRMLAERDPARLLVFCDEDADVKDPLAALSQSVGARASPHALAVLVGPEGGFADDERTALLHLPNVVRIVLGPRILRGDTAGVAALALVQSVLGDWR
jgi:16S rRNA (uracil1498-N3)-methyltransferase